MCGCGGSLALRHSPEVLWGQGSSWHIPATHVGHQLPLTPRTLSLSTNDQSNPCDRSRAPSGIEAGSAGPWIRDTKFVGFAGDGGRPTKDPGSSGAIDRGDRSSTSVTANEAYMNTGSRERSHSLWIPGRYHSAGKNIPWAVGRKSYSDSRRSRSSTLQLRVSLPRGLPQEDQQAAMCKTTPTSMFVRFLCALFTAGIFR
jgi:hypothetical protein